jgi:glutathione S-transferase
VDRIVARPGCNRGRNVPKPHTLLEYQNMSDEEIIKSAEEARAWVQQSMKEEAVKQKAREGEKQHEM